MPVSVFGLLSYSRYKSATILLVTKSKLQLSPTISNVKAPSKFVTPLKPLSQ